MYFPPNDPTNDRPRNARQDDEGSGPSARRGKGSGQATQRGAKRAPWRKPSARAGRDEGDVSNHGGGASLS